jgi:hypothetical protein
MCRGKNRPKHWATSIIFNKLLKINNRQIGENSSNLVTLEAKLAGNAGFHRHPETSSKATLQPFYSLWGICNIRQILVKIVLCNIS